MMRHARKSAPSACAWPMIKRLCAALLLLPLLWGGAQAQLRGHGGPVRALAISPDGKSALSGSFDTSAIRWSLERNVAEQVLRFHDGAVNAVAWLKDGAERCLRQELDGLVTAPVNKEAIIQAGQPFIGQTRTVRSHDAEAMRWPSGDTASDTIGAV